MNTVPQFAKGDPVIYAKAGVADREALITGVHNDPGKKLVFDPLKMVILLWRIILLCLCFFSSMLRENITNDERPLYTSLQRKFTTRLDLTMEVKSKLSSRISAKTLLGLKLEKSKRATAQLALKIVHRRLKELFLLGTLPR